MATSSLEMASSEATPEAVSWFQTKEDVHVRYLLPKGTKKAQVKVIMKKNKLFVNVPPSSSGSTAPAIIDPPNLALQVQESFAVSPDGGELYMNVDPDGSTWTIERDVNGEDLLHITLTKVAANQWPSLLKGLFCPISLVEQS